MVMASNAGLHSYQDRQLPPTQDVDMEYLVCDDIHFEVETVLIANVYCEERWVVMDLSTGSASFG
jgi:hypothetical protein